MSRKAVILRKGTKYNICCDLDFLPDFMEYIMKNEDHAKEIRIIFTQILEGLKTLKFSDEPYGTKAMKPFKNRQNDRIICFVLKKRNDKTHIIMSELFQSKKTNKNDKKIKVRYEQVSKYKYELVE